MTKSHVHPFGLRLIGLSDEERATLSRQFTSHHRHGGHLYRALHEDNLEDPDLYLVNIDMPGAMDALDRLRPAPLRPALLIGTEPVDLPHAFVPATAGIASVLAALDRLIAERAAAWSRLDASDRVTVPERRRRLPTADVDAVSLRRERRAGGVLVVDKDAAFAQAVAQALAGRQLRVDRANDHRTAAILCRQLDASLVFINTETPGLDPYRLCEAITVEGRHPITVIFIAGRFFHFHSGRARAVGCEGFVNRPLGERQLASLLEKFLPRSASTGTGGRQTGPTE